MNYYHVIITEKKRAEEECKSDLTKGELETKILSNYNFGKPIILNGRTITMNNIERIEVFSSEAPISNYRLEVAMEDKKSFDDMFFITPYGSEEYRAIQMTTNVTDEFIQGPPGNIESTSEIQKSKTKSQSKVFIVHGHDETLKHELEIFLHNIGIQPIVLHRQADEGFTIIEKFEKYSEVDYAFVLLTPDDIAFKSSERTLEENKRCYEFRARQNVIFEMGYFIAKLGRQKVCVLFKEGVSVPSDIQGLVYKKIENTIEDVGFSIIKELKQAGLTPIL